MKTLKQINCIEAGCNSCKRHGCMGVLIDECPGKVENIKKGYTFLELALKNSLPEVSTLLDLAGLVFSPNQKGYGFQLIRK